MLSLLALQPPVLLAFGLGAATLSFFVFSGAATTKDAPASGATMKKIFLKSPNADMNKVELEVKNVPIPRLKKGQVLVKVSAAPVNPSDYGVWITSEGGRAIGNEGSGVVVASGGGFVARRMVGKTVGFVAQETGSYGEYSVVDALKGCFPLSSAPVEDCASFFVNPFTVIAMIHTAQKIHKTNVFIHTAAASQLGQMMVKLCKTMDVKVVNLVRRREQVKLLKDLGAEIVVCQEDSDWEEQLKNLISKMKIKVAFDCIGGKMSGQLVSMLPPKSTTYVYGGLAKEPVGGVPIVDLIYRKKQVKGFLLTHWLLDGGILGTLSRVRFALKLVDDGLKKGGWAESQFVDCRPEEMQKEFLKMWNGGGFTGAKLRIRFD
uniref:Enoyl reductase (ER) domain-containing protein n=1 Tax=Chromera velia CCMP2878 TaxID=1169474 RepID=A0A0G4FIV1_9ALVE|mmetsp:Transcript_17201/g.34878  ORF Transcript_17201/g.34878 Transcript_17201/m.34878 type:complete len:376 (+) Transcript_17201:138-1265(+)|eukprot:Cvel_17143.t1-p1 / transcript=Cvel_17143.t1 / gene=Cvel_17143 / organism=Chromera_velia_CCMP2878 / gene_product=Trans-2-enoyl-CoA reductase, mitochondrial, putative / transcript_product=Trans-2-enoyl-CoA reductase, mitochondrial, putative / location=Cvel_scaffold1354:1330-2454(-) / protein_length=375 / sequence_SO=supercontig / SO=protein_coding / is_pseudo=false